MGTKHWHTMNGSSGCMPDNNTISTSKRDAIASAQCVFDDVPARGMVADLRRHEIHYFADPRSAGADYVSVTECRDDCDLDADY